MVGNSRGLRLSIFTREIKSCCLGNSKWTNGWVCACPYSYGRYNDTDRGMESWGCVKNERQKNP